MFFGESYLAGVLPFKILLVGVLFYTLAQVNNSVISGIGKPKVVTKIIFLVAALNIILNLLLIPTYKLTGAATATAISYIVALILSIKQMIKFVSLKVPWMTWFKTFVSSMVFVFVVINIKSFLSMNVWFELVITLAFSLAIYVVLILLSKTVDINEVKELFKRVVK